MYIVIITSVIALLLTYLETKGSMRNGMMCGFILVTILGAIHFDYGNDYMSYYNLYHDIVKQSFNLDNIMSGVLFKEPGWILLYYAFSYFGGFFMFVAVISVVQNIIIYKYIKREVPKNLWPSSVFVYLFCMSYFLMSFTMLRQFFVMCIFLGMWPYIKSKKWWIPLIVLFLSSFIHSSARLLIPFSFMSFIPMKKNKVVTIAFAIIIIAFWIGGSWINDMIEQVITVSDSEAYVVTYGNNDVSAMKLGVGFVIQEIPLLVGLYYLLSSKYAEESQKQLVLLSLIGFAIIPLNSIFPMIGRLGGYFGIFQIASVPIIYYSIRNVSIRNILVMLFVLITLYDYILFFSPGSVFAPHYQNFHTIFSVL